ncbi:unnamed protein product [Moneuplotes crassus]|uniref:Uncharacterized protein n=1 Tax=Euplotes crassus TaxID=5936 RepID=A0AAD1X548_EUPCR|nr:unnamed protein product [Moneuplotes crassus]
MEDKILVNATSDKQLDVLQNSSEEQNSEGNFKFNPLFAIDGFMLTFLPYLGSYNKWEQFCFRMCKTSQDYFSSKKTEIEYLYQQTFSSYEEAVNDLAPYKIGARLINSNEIKLVFFERIENVTNEVAENCTDALQKIKLYQVKVHWNMDKHKRELEQDLMVIHKALLKLLPSKGFVFRVYKLQDPQRLDSIYFNKKCSELYISSSTVDLKPFNDQKFRDIANYGVSTIVFINCTLIDPSHNSDIPVSVWENEYTIENEDKKCLVKIKNCVIKETESNKT